MASHCSYKNQNSSYQGKFQGNVDQGKGNLDQASEELELSDGNSFGGREFFIVGEIFVDRTFFIYENFLSMENFFIDRESIKQSRISSSIENTFFFIGVSTGQQSLLAPLHNRQDIKANSFILRRLGKNQPCKVRM